jgi:hypothetical protein
MKQFYSWLPAPLFLPYSDKQWFETDIFFHLAPKEKASFLKGAHHSFGQNPFSISWFVQIGILHIFCIPISCCFLQICSVFS